MGVVKYNHRRVSPPEFERLLKGANLSITDFLYLTGRRRDQVEKFLMKEKGDYVPTMGDVMVLELASRDEDVAELMFEIAADYDDGPRYQRRK